MRNVLRVPGVWLGLARRTLVGAALIALAAGTTLPGSAGAEESATIAQVGRLVANLDQSVEYYEALGFTKDAAESKGWSRDRNIETLFGVSGIETRVAKMQATTSASGKFFPVYLREVRGIERRNHASRSMWRATSTHIGLHMEHIQQTWDKLRQQGILRAHSWADELQPVGRPTGQLAYIADPDGLDVEVIARAQNGKPGVNHFGLVVADIEKAKAFYIGLLGGKPPAEEPKWLQGDFFDSVVGGHGGIVRLFFLTFPETVAPESTLNFELIDFQNRKAPIDRFSITDIGVNYYGFQVPDFDGFLKRALAMGATQVSKNIVTSRDGTREVLLRDPDTGAFVLFRGNRR